mmetsp:Transcript_12778/g.14666  ORF Transcript_12778/g.14666 Transcript_12778/m.14666 type:complete len:428 (+) Transcript_12778:322-1605(+)|eukprot:CAMPEP_0184028582 /NCGR_PEP_ID=MMETSP0954-20121128/14927_1 /TAXON_ID=627963 /ORGANISM="Aplanochytrium sp, Strain PBS07" /LENGTH=427 /DNA_ID=CAMNT_0026313455 /DNA_START=269 /DNA_END=1552 /DNA_ORIENTATION=-
MYAVAAMNCFHKAVSIRFLVVLALIVGAFDLILDSVSLGRAFVSRSEILIDITDDFYAYVLEDDGLLELYDDSGEVLEHPGHDRKMFDLSANTRNALLNDIKQTTKRQESKMQRLRINGTGENQTEQVSTEIVSNEEWCINAFLTQGFVPPVMYRNKTTDEVKEWEERKCRRLFCENKGRHRCKWSYFALKTLQNDAMECTEDRLEEFKMDERWRAYQFSDFFHNIHGNFSRDFWNSTFVWPDSLFGEYQREAVNRGLIWDNYNLLLDIVKKRAKRVGSPDPNVTVIHLRLGDVMGRPNQTVLDLLHHQQYFYGGKKFDVYVKPLSLYSSMRKKNGVVLMGGLHQLTDAKDRVFDDDLKSCQYVMIVKRYLEARGCQVELRLGRHPDDDIVYASQSKTYVKGGGGYSRLIAQLVKRSGGKVMERTHY